jgi:hypothetical protein
MSLVDLSRFSKSTKPENHNFKEKHGMTLTNARSQLSGLLEHVAQSLDIPDEVHEEAVKKYEEVGHWLEEQDQKNGRREPLVYPQGSFRLGTTIRPMSEDHEYDIDLVYERDLRKGSVSQAELKQQTGEHLKSFVEHCKRSHRDAPTLTEGARCWRLDYPDQFHMDILPAIPDYEGRTKRTLHCKTAIEITDRDVREWQSSNPIGYGEWFKMRMLSQFLAKRAQMARGILEAKGMATNDEYTVKAAAEEVPEYKVKTPLQRAIQILKRHRDFYFKDDPDHRPVSIILTTLAARAYNNEADLVAAMLTLVRDMPKHIEIREVNGKHVSWVPNPINDNENFADRWQDPKYPSREIKFRGWLQKVDEDLTTALKGGGIQKVIDILGNSLGQSTLIKAASAIGVTAHQQSQSSSLSMTKGTGTLTVGVGTSAATTPVRRHTFYGDEPNQGN